MKIINFLYVLAGIYKAKLLKKRIPLAVSFALTSRCNQKCSYCGIWKNPIPELKSGEIIKIIDGLVKAGTRWISFTGGEPLLRDDLESILRYIKKKGIYISLSSNGRLVSSKINSLLYLDRIKLSIDGPELINDKIRGKGSFKNVIKAIQLCKSKGINTDIECVLSRYNSKIEYIDYLIGLAKKYKLKVLFQPTTKNLLQSDIPNLVAIDQKKYKKIICHLMKRKREGTSIFNSIAGLNHLYVWPQNKKIACSAGSLSFDVEPDGKILACDRKPEYGGIAYEDIDWTNLKKTLKGMKLGEQCNRCWCSSLVEMNLIFSFNPDAIFNYLFNN